MIATERTPLTRVADPANPNFSFIRRRKSHQLRCCLWASLVAIFIMMTVMMVSFFINEAAPDMGDPVENAPITEKLSWMREKLSPGESDGASLTEEEWQSAFEAGKRAIEMRIEADENNTPLPSPSPDSRHRYAVKTSVAAGKLALGGIGELAAMRNIETSRLRLGKTSSRGSYFKNVWIPAGACRRFSVTNCTVSKYRSYDGTCNHPENLGAALTPFARNLPADYADGIEAPRAGKTGKSLPSAREISLKVHPPSPSSNPAFTVMLAVFGQFLDHDITATAISQGKNGSSLSCCSSGNFSHPECFPVRVGPGDPVFDLAGKRCMEFVRSAPAPQCKIAPREQMNQVSSFIDASVIYGPDRETADSLRAGKGGLLRMFRTPDNRTLLPQSTSPNDGCNRELENLRGRYCFASGDGRANENLHLTTMHLIWARQHNRLAEALSGVNPSWSDERVYQESRRIVGAQLQHVAYSEFVPVVLGEKEVNSRKLRPLGSGYRERGANEANPEISNSFASSAFRFAHTLIPGLMKLTNDQKGSSSYVELHRMLFNPYSLYAKGGIEDSLRMAASNPIQRTTTHVTSQLTSHLFEDPLANATLPCGLDLVSLNIQRGRDHGIPGYTAWRKFCGLGDVRSFEELAGHLDPEALKQISQLYDDVDDVDLYTGALAEIGDGDGLVGPTFKCLVGDQFERLQQGDRFWYEVPDAPQAFTQGQLNEIRKTSLAKIICDCSDEITEIQPEVMRSVSAENPMVSCVNLPGMDLTLWRENSSPIVSASEVTTPSPAATTPRPEVWIRFENEIKTTVNELVDAVNKSTIPRNTSWIVFKDWFSKSFADLRNEIISITSNTTVVAGSKNNVLETVVGAAGASKKSRVDPTKAGGVSLDPTYDDWIKLKKNISEYLSAKLERVGVPTAKQRGELMGNLSVEFVKLRNVINMIKTNKNDENNAGAKNSILQNLDEDIYEREPPVNKKSKKDSKKMPLDDLQFSSLMDDWKDFKKKINDSLMSGSLGSSTESEDWALFRDSIRRKFAEFGKEIDIVRSGNVTESRTIEKKLETDVKRETKEKTSEIKGIEKKMEKGKEPRTVVTNLTLGAIPTKTPFIPAADWIAFKEEVKSSIQEFVKSVNSTEIEQWNETKDLITKLHDDLHDKIMSLKNDLTKP